LSNLKKHNLTLSGEDLRSGLYVDSVTEGKCAFTGVVDKIKIP